MTVKGHPFGDVVYQAKGWTQRKWDALNAESMAVADQFGLQQSPTNHNDERDAFRHAYVSALLAHEYTLPGSMLLMEGYELTHPNSEAEHYMDRHNNFIGQIIGARANSKSELGQMVYDALKKGHLIPHVSTLPAREGW